MIAKDIFHNSLKGRDPSLWLLLSDFAVLRGIYSSPLLMIEI